MVVTQERRTTNSELIRKCISNCKAFVVPSIKENGFNYFYGGGFYDGESSSIVLYTDYIRLSSFKIIDANHIVHIMYDGEHCDILFDSGIWISGMVVKKIKGVRYDYPHRRFMDDRVLREYGGIKVVDLLSIQPTAVEQNVLCSIHMPPTKLLDYPNPLTFAYVTEEDEIRIGYWDMVENRLVGDTERMEMSLLDKSV